MKKEIEVFLTSLVTNKPIDNDTYNKLKNEFKTPTGRYAFVLVLGKRASNTTIGSWKPFQLLSSFISKFLTEFQESKDTNYKNLAVILQGSFTYDFSVILK